MLVKANDFPVGKNWVLGPGFVHSIFPTGKNREFSCRVFPIGKISR